MITLGTIYVVFEDVIHKDDFFNLNKDLKKEIGCYLEVRNYINTPDDQDALISATLGVRLTDEELYKKYNSSNILMINQVCDYIKKWHIHNHRNVDVMTLNVNDAEKN